VERACARGALLVQFLDVAHLSSVRTLPYLVEWSRRYGDAGLSIVAVNSPRFAFTADREKLAAAVGRLELPFPVALDASYEAWHDYGCEGWPSLFLWGGGGALRWFHFGEGEYQGTEAAIQRELRETNGEGLELPRVLAPLRPGDAPGALVAAPTPEVFPGGSVSEPWTFRNGDPPLELEYAAAGAWVAVDGNGPLRATLDGRDERTIEIQAPGAYELITHPCTERHHLALLPSSGQSVYSIAFAAGVP
jgi:hypothetical protein